ncbi:MAG: tyrosine-type recombinase/integrase [Thermodesulfobacteriota bacterium]|nr:tyrosine-type recombinase/integrase [Thermodesulfobacteriota bacterium]
MSKRRIPGVLLAVEQQAILDQFLPNETEDEDEGLSLPGRPRSALSRLRDLCIIRLLLNSGLRCGEALHLRRRDLEPTTGKLWVRNGKGGKDRGLWLCEADVNLLMGYFANQPGGHEDLIFTNLKGGPLSDRYVRYMVAEVAVSAGITYKHVHPHTLRHTFATDLLRATKNLRLVQKALGHERIGTTQIYTHIVDEELEDAMKNFRNGGG